MVLKMTEATTPTLFDFKCKVKDQTLLKLAEFQECLLFFALLKFITGSKLK